MDKYDRAEAKLLAADNFAEAVNRAWNSPWQEYSGCLFTFVTPTGNIYVERDENMIRCGCLTQVRSGKLPACTPELTSRILNDETLPTYPDGVTRENIHRFTEWQRELDAMFPGRNVDEEFCNTVYDDDDE